MAVQKVNGQDLAQLESRLLEKISSINGQVKSLQATIDHLEGGWRGIGAGAFNMTQTKINNRMNELNRLLAQYLEGIEGTRKLSGNNEDDVAAAFRGVDVVDSGVGVDGSGAPASKLNQY